MNEDLILENDEPEEDNKDNGKLELGEISKNNSEQQEVNYLIIHNLKDENYTKSIKVILCGESRVGKTSLINRLCYGNYSDDVPTTTSIRHYDYFIKIEDFILRMQIWDISGQEKKELIIRDNFFETDYAIFIYSIDDKESFNKIRDWFLNLKEYNKNNEIKSTLLANKKDLDSKRVITFEQGQNLAKEYNFTNFKEITCKINNEEDNKNIINVFDNIALLFYQYHKLKVFSIDSDSFNYEATNSMMALEQNDSQEENKKVEIKSRKPCCCCCYCC